MQYSTLKIASNQLIIAPKSMKLWRIAEVNREKRGFVFYVLFLSLPFMFSVNTIKQINNRNVAESVH